MAVRAACERTLKELRLSELDLYLIHFPIALQYVDFDTRYPQFTPRKGFVDRVKQMRAAGIHVVPYTNGRLFDPEIAAWNATNASSHMCVSADGPYREIYHTTGPAANISFYLADPADSYWQNLFTGIARDMRVAGVDGMYLP